MCSTDRPPRVLKCTWERRRRMLATIDDRPRRCRRRRRAARRTAVGTRSRHGHAALTRPGPRAGRAEAARAIGYRPCSDALRPGPPRRHRQRVPQANAHHPRTRPRHPCAKAPGRSNVAESEHQPIVHDHEVLLGRARRRRGSRRPTTRSRPSTRSPASSSPPAPGGLTQDAVAQRMGTTKGAQLESR